MAMAIEVIVIKNSLCCYSCNVWPSVVLVKNIVVMPLKVRQQNWLQNFVDVPGRIQTSLNCQFSLCPLGLLTRNRLLGCHGQNRDSSVITRDDLVPFIDPMLSEPTPLEQLIGGYDA
jgi:hypothetical protein